MTKKNNPSELTVEQRLETLYKLQTALSAIDEKKALRGELPLEVEDLDAEIEGLTTRISRIEGEIAEFEHAISQKRGEITEAEASIERYKKQLDEVRNNREYDMLNKEIEFQSLEVELCNKKIAEAEHRIADRRADLDNARRQLEEKRGDLEVKKSELDEIISETRIEEDRLQIQVRELESLIDPGLLNSFLRIRKNARNGLGIVYVHRDACGGCFNKIPPQRQMDIRMHKKIIVCEYCGRILIDPELADVPVEKPVEEDKKPARKRATARKSASSKKTTDANDME